MYGWYTSRLEAEGQIPVSSPAMTTPTLHPLFSGRENWEAIGIKI